MKEDGFLTVIWSDDRELPFRDLVVFVMCAKRSRKNHRAKKWGTMITNFLHLLTIAVMKCLADVVHAHMCRIWATSPTKIFQSGLSSVLRKMIAFVFVV